MMPSKTNRQQVLNYGLPLFVILSSIVIAMSPLLKQYPELAIGITYDLTLIAPLLFLLLIRKSGFSKFRAVPFFIGGTIIASYLLPESGQRHLMFIKTFVLPAVEVAVFLFLIRKVFLGIKTIKTKLKESPDFLIVSKDSAAELFGKSKLATFLASEISMFYYAFFAWKPKKRQPNEFTNFKENATIAIAGSLLMIVFIETYAFHILLMNWSIIAAWVLTGTSIYTAIMIFGHMKALLKRPSILTDKHLILKNGLVADCKISLDEIESIEAYTKEMTSEEFKIGNLGFTKDSTNHNIAIHFKRQQTIEKLYGFSDKCDVLLIHMDNKSIFIEKVAERIQSS